MEPYESIYTGSFIFTLGYLTKPAGLELSQQTVALLCQNRGDELAGDLLHSWQGRNFIIEFKRNEGSVRDEFRKPHKRRLLETLKSSEGMPVRGVSRRGHFIAYGVSDNRMAGLVFMRYFEAEDAPVQTMAHLGLQRFFEGVITNRRAGLSRDEFKAYVTEVVRISGLHGVDESGGVEPLEMPTLVLNYDETTRRIRFLTVDIMRVLELSLERSRPRLVLEPSR